MRNFKQIVWTDEFYPETSEPVLVCLLGTSNVYYRVACWGGNAWRYVNNGNEIPREKVAAWAYIPQCAFVYPMMEVNDND